MTMYYSMLWFEYSTEVGVYFLIIEYSYILLMLTPINGYHVKKVSGKIILMLADLYYTLHINRLFSSCYIEKFYILTLHYDETARMDVMDVTHVVDGTVGMDGMNGTGDMYGTGGMDGKGVVDGHA